MQWTAIEYTLVDDGENIVSDIKVEWRGGGTWAVTQSGECLNKSGGWEPEPHPSNRDDAFIQRCRFKLEEARQLAEVAVNEQRSASKNR